MNRTGLGGLSPGLPQRVRTEVDVQDVGRPLDFKPRGQMKVDFLEIRLSRSARSCAA
jgi:hypothetical protein